MEFLGISSVPFVTSCEYSPVDQDAAKVASRSSDQREPSRQSIRTLLQAQEISSDDPEFDSRVRVSPRGGLFQIGQGQVPIVALNLGLRSAEESFREFGITSEDQSPLDHGFVDFAECDQTGRLVKMDTVQRPGCDGLIEIFESVAMFTGEGPQNAAKFEQSRLVQLDLEAAFNVIPGSAGIAAEEPDPGADEERPGSIRRDVQRRGSRRRARRSDPPRRPG